MVILFSSEYAKYTKLLTASLIKGNSTYLCTNNCKQQRRNVDVTTVNADHLLAQKHFSSTLQNADLIITVGPKALQYTLLTNNNAIPVIASLISRRLYKKILYNYKKLNYNLHLDKVSALYIDQPVSRLLKLTKVIQKHNPHIQTLGILLSKESSRLKPKVEKIAKEHNLNSFIYVASENENITQAMRKVLDNSDILLVVPDLAIFNSSNVTGMLMTAIRNGVPVIGYSRAYARAGALAVVYATPTEHIQEITNLALSNLHQYIAPNMASKYVANYLIYVNDSVAQATKLKLPKDTMVVKNMMENID